MLPIRARVGTPAFMSPEQCDGAAIDHRSDMYSLGVTFYVALTGYLPYNADSPFAIMLKHKNDPIPLPSTRVPELDKRVDDLVRRPAAKKPGDRFDDYGLLIEHVGNIIDALTNGDGDSEFSLGGFAESGNSEADDNPGWGKLPDLDGPAVSAPVPQPVEKIPEVIPELSHTELGNPIQGQTNLSGGAGLSFPSTPDQIDIPAMPPLSEEAPVELAVKADHDRHPSTHRSRRSVNGPSVTPPDHDEALAAVSQEGSPSSRLSRRSGSRKLDVDFSAQRQQQLTSYVEQAEAAEHSGDWQQALGLWRDVLRASDNRELSGRYQARVEAIEQRIRNRKRRRKVVLLLAAVILILALPYFAWPKWHDYQLQNAYDAVGIDIPADVRLQNLEEVLLSMVSQLIGLPQFINSPTALPFCQRLNKKFPICVFK